MDGNLNPNLCELFGQLGLSSKPQDVKAFIKEHSALGIQDFGHDPYWNASQREFLHKTLEEDSDWARAIDELSELLYNKK